MQSAPPMRQLFLLFSILILAATARAQVVESEVSPGVRAFAEYSPGEEGAEVVLILHGFLQTHNFYTVKRLHDSLAESGFSVLSPTLSLGIDKRTQSLGCEALHLHDLPGDVAELAHWVEWLHKKHGRDVVLIGHSAGGVVMTRYLYDNKDAPVKRGIMISLSYLRGTEHKAGKEPMGEYSLGFCNKYATLPQAYLSYVDWNQEKIIASIRGYRNPVSLILGSGDDRLDPEWRRILADSGVDIVNIDGANHFFDSAHEFDLLEAVENILAGS